MTSLNWQTVPCSCSGNGERQTFSNFDKMFNLRNHINEIQIRMVQLPATAAIEYVAACCRTRTKTRTKTKTVRGLMPVPPKFNAYTNCLGFLCLAS